MPAALVTGATRRAGIAAAVVRALRRDGWSVATSGWRPYDASEPWGSQSEEAEEIGGGTFVEADLSDPEAPARLVAAAQAAIGPLTALVAVHTESRPGGILDADAADFDRHLAVNARSVLLLAAEFARRFRAEEGSGRIVVFTSDALHGEVAYGASKAALERVVVAAATELGPSGITVNAIDPGPTDTGWMSPELRDRFEAGTPLGRAGRPDDAAELAAPLLASRGLDHGPDDRLRRRLERPRDGPAGADAARGMSRPGSPPAPSHSRWRGTTQPPPAGSRIIIGHTNTCYSHHSLSRWK